MELVNSLNTEFGISDDVNSARLHIFQFMEDTHDVTTFNTFTKGELISDVLRMDYHQYHGKATNVRKAVQYGAKILQVSFATGWNCLKGLISIIYNQVGEITFHTGWRLDAVLCQIKNITQVVKFDSFVMILLLARVMARFIASAW